MGQDRVQKLVQIFCQVGFGKEPIDAGDVHVQDQG